MRQIWTLGPRLFLTHDLQLRFFENLRLCQLLSGLHPDQPFINGCSNEAIDVRLNLPDGIALAVQYDYFVANKFHGCVPLEKSPPGRARRHSLRGGSFQIVPLFFKGGLEGGSHCCIQTWCGFPTTPLKSPLVRGGTGSRRSLNSFTAPLQGGESNFRLWRCPGA